MKVKWEDFAKRRDLDLQVFIENMKYEKYVQWCKQRSVVPVSVDLYVSSKEEDELESIEHKVQKVSHDWNKISKRVKSEIQKLCDMEGIEYESNDTKKTLIRKLKNSHDA